MALGYDRKQTPMRPRRAPRVGVIAVAVDPRRLDDDDDARLLGLDPAVLVQFAVPPAGSGEHLAQQQPHLLAVGAPRLTTIGVSGNVRRCTPSFRVPPGVCRRIQVDCHEPSADVWGMCRHDVELRCPGGLLTDTARSGEPVLRHGGGDRLGVVRLSR